jgi:hypothetical protein
VGEYQALEILGCRRSEGDLCHVLQVVQRDGLAGARLLEA